MNKLIYILSILLLANICTFASSNTDSAFIESSIVLHTSSGDIFGTLTTPKKFKKIPVALIIAGSGPTDRNGNSMFTKNDALKKLAFELAEKKIASVRFDKKGIGESIKATKSEADLRFEDYINDARAWIALLKKDKRFTKITVVGHSEGSLIGMIAATDANKFVSIAGAGRAADEIIKEQLSAQPKQMQETSFPIIDSLKEGKRVEKVPPMLFTLFRPSVQPYIISWFKYNPQEEIKKLKIPILIVQGTNDIQVSVNDAQLLSKAAPKAKLVLIENMNHIFRNVDGDKAENIKTYGNPSLPLADGLVREIAGFILK